jgi:GNAT superfamily N-acetyltransferase
MLCDVAIRQAEEGDKAFLLDTYATVMRPYVEWAWGWDEKFQRSGFWSALRVADFKLVLVNNLPAGGVCVRTDAGERTLQMVILASEFQGKGIGRSLVEAEISLARNAGELLKLWVIKTNPAKRMYERLGFATVGEDDVRYLMQVA